MLLGRAHSSPRTSWWSTCPSDATAACRDRAAAAHCGGRAAPGRPSGSPAAPRRARRSATSPRCTRRWCSAPATTSARTGSPKRCIGLSGGIDSSLVATVAVDALGRGRVHGISMPSRYSSEGSRDDAGALAERLGIDLKTVAIEEAHVAFASMLAPVLGREPFGLTDENLQSRLRGVLLMAVSNANGWIVLTTGNKSEMATGYSTLYGDSAGGFAVIKDVPKTLVYELCRYRNTQAVAEGLPGPIPDSVLDKPPSAELRPDQRDDQSLPPYEVLDPVLAGLRRARPHRGRAGGRGLRPRRWSTRWCGWSTGRSTSAGRCRRACASPRRRSARTGACPSPTATAPRPWGSARRPAVPEVDGRRSGVAGHRRAAELVGAYRWVEHRIFELTGAWATEAEDGPGAASHRRAGLVRRPGPPQGCWRPAGPSGSRCGRAPTGPPWWAPRRAASPAPSTRWPPRPTPGSAWRRWSRRSSPPAGRLRAPPRGRAAGERRPGPGGPGRCPAELAAETAVAAALLGGAGRGADEGRRRSGPRSNGRLPRLGVFPAVPAS